MESRGKLLKKHVIDGTDGELFCFHRTRLQTQNGSELPFVSHTHKRYEIMQLIEGAVTYVVDGRCYNLNEGDIIIINQNEFHSVRPKGTIYERRVVEFNLKFLLHSPSRFFQALAPFENAEQVFGNHIPVELVNKFNLNYIIDNIEACIEDKQDTELMLYIYTFELIMAIKKIWRTVTVENVVTVDNSIVEKAMQYINDNLEKRITLADLEDYLHVSKFHISHLFKKTIGTSVMTYVVFKKMHYAETLIINGMPPTEVGKKIGYENYSNFHSNYKKVIKTSPRASIKRG